ncbi:hypothetical protein PaeCFBP13512_22310 [Paenibacillus sp. CFBP13512]|uniref:glycoside hydrolase domain-containing protein n=1 Tax=Paenibacillus sp. CFBP13512 TaxID=2184007 RepID=UPI0010C08C83|nr:glycoside hydrolase domain-containing protein [Paenibacillus sp. CFBP13512]TKJ83752.1 hypothetical protein PaeCFBP13512_22310 [Paenibacillus sp. CFBP13512]
MDEMVLKVQQWANKTYTGRNGYIKINEDGQTGWGTIRALIRGLQLEIGIPDPTGSFGPATTDACPTLSSNSDYTNGSISNQIRILQGAMYCKGYNPTGFTGIYGDGTKAAIARFQKDAGLRNVDGVASPMIIKALLNMDAFINVGDDKIRTIQQNLNRDYYQLLFKPLGLIPCDGRYARSTNKALIYALQSEQGSGSPDGSFGSTTKSLCPTLNVGSTKTKFVAIIQYALYLNNYDPGRFDGIYDEGVKSAVRNFQSFTKLTADGVAGKQTWASLLVSTGDNTRKGTACDCITTITPARAQTLKQNGYTAVGRYLTEVKIPKKIKPGELDTIFAAGLRVFPICQSAGNSLSYFTPEQGSNDARTGLVAANGFGFEKGTVIYFAVDYDAVDEEVTSHILPYFQALSNKMEALGSMYRIGVYGPRNICSRVSQAGYAVNSFVSDMSTGFSGNLGYNLPINWAFDQISTIFIGSGEGAIEIDNNIMSGRDLGVSKVSTPIELALDDVELPTEYKDLVMKEASDKVDELLTTLQRAKSVRTPQEAAQIVISLDEYITEQSRRFSIRKALIQSVLLRELSTEGQDDTVSDALVISYYAYKNSFEFWDNLPPITKAFTPAPTLPAFARPDASTGIGQIFASTAIDSINYAISEGLITGNPYDYEKWKEVEYIWNKLHNDKQFSIETCALVLIRAANLIGLPSKHYGYSGTEIKDIITRYNGKGEEALAYSDVVYQFYPILEKYNKLAREKN